LRPARRQAALAGGIELLLEIVEVLFQLRVIRLELRPLSVGLLILHHELRVRRAPASTAALDLRWRDG